MRKSISPTERRYKRLCGRVRRNGGFPFAPKPYQDYDEIEDAAILTYDYYDSEFSGWINRQRLGLFRKRSEQIANWKGYIPF